MKRHHFCFVLVALLVLLRLYGTANTQDNANFDDQIRSAEPAWEPIALSNHTGRMYCLMYGDMFRTLGLKLKEFDRKRVAIELGKPGFSAKYLEALVKQLDKIKPDVTLSVDQHGEVGIKSRDGRTIHQITTETLNEYLVGNETVRIQADQRAKAKQLTEIVNRLKELNVSRVSTAVVLRDEPESDLPNVDGPVNEPIFTEPAGVQTPETSGRNTVGSTAWEPVTPQPPPGNPTIPTPPSTPAPSTPKPPALAPSTPAPLPNIGPELARQPAPPQPGLPGVAAPESLPGPKVQWPTPPADTKENRKKLRHEVEVAFEARQQSQRAELRQLRERLARIEQSIAARQRNKEKIIQHRVAELLDPNLRWENDPGVARPVLNNPSQSMQVPEPENVSTGIPTTGRAPAEPVSSLHNSWMEMIRSASDLRSQIVDHEENVASYEAIIKHNPNHDDIGGMTARLKRARRELSKAQREFETLYQLMKVEQRNAQANLARTNTHHEQVEASRANKQQREEARRAYDDARLRADRINAILKIYHIDNPDGALPLDETTTAPSPGRSFPNATSIELLKADMEEKQARYRQLGRRSSRNQRDILRSELELLQSRLVGAMQEYEAREQSLSYDVDEAAAKLKLAEAKLARAKEANEKVAGTVTAIDVETLANQLELAKIALQRAQDRLSVHKGGENE